MSVRDTVSRAVNKCPCVKKAKALMKRRRLAREAEAKKSK